MTVRTWTGGGSDANWSTAANWSNGAPVSGDALVFSGTTRTATQDNFTAGTTFQSIEFAANSFSVSGNNLTLASGGITVDSGVTSSSISVGIALGSSVSINVVNTSLTLSGVISGSNSLTKTGNGALTLTNHNTYTGGTTVNAGTLALGAIITLANSSSLTISGATAKVSLTATDNAIWDPAHTGVLTISSGGTLSADASGGNEHTLGKVNLNGNATIAATQSGGGGYQNFVMSNTVFATGTGNTISASLCLPPAVGGFSVDSGSALTVSGVMHNFPSSTSSINKAGSGTLTLSGANTYSGGTTLSGGVLSLGSTGALASTGTITFGGGTLQFSSANTTDYSGRFSTAGSQAYNIDTNGQSVTFASVLGSTGGSLTKSGTGTLTLTGTNTYSAGTTINGGHLHFGPNSLPGTGSITINDAGFLDVAGPYGTVMGWLNSGKIVTSSAGTIALTADSSEAINMGSYAGLYLGAVGARTYSGVLTPSGTSYRLGGGDTLTVSGTLTGSRDLITRGNVALTGNNTYTGDTTISGGVLQVGVASGPGTLGFGRIVDNTSLVFDCSSTTVNGVISGSGSLTKRGSGTLTLGANETYTGPTTVEAGTLSVVQSLLNSHITVAGGAAISGVVFYDPDLAAAVRQALGMTPDTVLTPSNVSPLTSLSADSNLISNLTGLNATNAPNLTSLTLVPSDFSSQQESLSTLSPLGSLANLKTLTLQHCGLTDTVLGTLGSPTALQTLDVRYNDIHVVPSSVAGLSTLDSLLVYGNSYLADHPRDGLANLAGKLINIDLAPDHPETATTITDLAAALYKLPIEMYEYVVNTIEFQPYQGAMKGALAVMQTKAGNDWDTVSLLAGLLSAAGVPNTDIQYVFGQVKVPVETAEEYVGATTPIAAANLLLNSGLNASFADNNTSLQFDHAWLQARFSAGGAWMPLDPTWKFQSHRDQPQNMLTSVTFDPDPRTGGYFAEAKTEMASEYYEDQVRNWLAANQPGTTVADVAYRGPILTQVIAALPTALPFAVVGSPTYQSSIPSSRKNRVEVELWNADKTTKYFDSGMLNVPDICLQALTIRPTVSGSNVVPTLLENFQATVCQSSAALAPTTSIVVRLKHFNGDGDDIQDTLGYPNPEDYSRKAGDYIAISLDANQISSDLVQSQYRVANTANINYLNNSASFDLDSNVGSLLNLVGLKFYYETDAGEQSICNLTAAVPLWNHVASGLTTSATSLRSIADQLQKKLQFPCLPDKMNIDVPNGAWGALSIDGTTADWQTRMEMLGYTNSSEENAIWEDITDIDTISTVKSLQMAMQDQSGNGVLKLASVSDWNAYQNQLNGNREKATIGDLVAAGYTVFTPKNDTDLGGWNGVGYVAEIFRADGSYEMRYTISGGYNGGEEETLDGGYTSLLSPQDFQVPPPSIAGQYYTPDPINVANGDVTHDETDINIPNLGVPLAFGRHYDSYNTVSGLTGAPTPWSDRGLGEGWSFTYSDRLDVTSDGSVVTWFNDKGVKSTFTKTGGTYTNPDGLFGTLTGSNSAGYTWTDKNGSTVVFNAADGNLHCSLRQVLDRYGSGVDIAYLTGTTKIDRVKDHLAPTTRYLQFTYTGSYITSIADFTGRTWTYGYTNNRLTSVMAPSDGQTQPVVGYAYYTDNARLGLLYRVTDPASGVTQYDYYANRRGFEVWYGFTTANTEAKPQSLSYNVFRDRTSFTDERGATTYYDYDKDNNGVLLQELHPDRTTEVYTWSPANSSLKTSAADAYGQTESYVYDSSNMGDLTQVTDRLGYVTNYTYTANYHNVDTITRHNSPSDPNDDQVTKFTYDAQGSLTDETDSYGVLDYHTTYVPSSSGLVLSMTTPDGYLTPADPNDYTTTYTYNGAGQVLTRVTRVSPTVSITETLTYDNRGNMLTSTDGNGNTTTYTYDPLNRRTTQTLPDPDGIGTGLPAPHTTYTYDAAGNLTNTTIDTPTTDARSVLAVYDKKQRVTKTTNADGTYITNVYDPAGNVASTTDALGRITRYVYDSRNRCIATIQPDGSIVRTQYDGGSRVVGTTDALGNTTRYEYDKVGRKTEEIQADPNLAAATTVDDGGTGFATSGSWPYYYNAGVGGHSIAASGTSSSATWTFSNLRTDTEYEIFVTWVQNSTNTTSAPYAVYDGTTGGTLLTTVNVNQQNAPGLDPNMGAGWLSLGTFLTTSGTLTVKLTGTSSGYVVADAARLTVGGSTTSYGYDTRGNLQYITNTSLGASLGDPSHTTEYEYDNLGRMTKQKLADPDGSGPLARPTTQYAYDANGNLTSVTDARGYVTNYQYDEANRKTQQILPDPDGSGPLGTLTTRYFYDNDGNLRYVVDPRGTDAKEAAYTTEYDYDNLGRKITAIAPDPDGADPLTRPTTDYVYDADGNLASMTDPLGNSTWYQYDKLGRQTKMTDALGSASGDPAHTTTAWYDAVGNVLFATDALGRITATQYDTMNRAVSVQQPRSDSSTSGTAPTTTYQYDANGNQISVADPLGHTTWYQYDALNRQVGVTDALGWRSGDPQHTTVTQYDALGNVVAVTDPLGQTTKYLYDNLGRTIETIAPDPSTGQASESDPNCPKTHYRYDAAGNLTAVVDPRGYGTTYDYDALGRQIRQFDSLLTDGLAGYWRLDDGAGTTAADSSGNGHDGSFNGTGQQWVDGQYGGGLQFGSTNQVEATNVAVNTAAGAKNTIALWMKWDGTSNGIVCNLGTSYYNLYINHYHMSINTGHGDYVGFTFPSGTYIDQWIHVAVVFYNGTPSPENVAIYVNGERKELRLITGTPCPEKASSTVYLSGDRVGGQGFTGVLDDVRVYNRELSAAEVVQVMQSPATLTSTTYDAVGNVIAVTDPLGRTTDYAYDNLGRKTSEIQPDPDGDGVLTRPVTSYAYDADGNLASTTDPLGNVTRYGYDALNRQTQVTDALGSSLGDSNHTTVTAYDAVGNVVAVADPDGNVTQYDYDRLGRQVAEEQYDPTGMVVTEGLVGYWKLDDGAGTTATDSSGNGHDGSFARTGEQWVDGRYGGGLQFTTTSQMSASGVAVNSDDGAKNTIALWMKWDGTSNGIVCNLGSSYYNLYINHYHMSINTGHGDYVGFTFPSGTYIDQWIHVAVVFYNGTPSPENVAIYVNGERKELRLITGTPCPEKASSTVYLSGDRVGGQGFTGVLDDVRVYNRELTGDEVLEVMHSARRQSAVYNAAGNLVQKTDRDGRVTQYVYDPLNRQVEENWLDADSNVFHTIHTYYDADGQVLGISESDTQNAAAGTLYQYTYDADGRVTSARMAPGDLSQPGPLASTDSQLGDAGESTTDWDLDGTAERYDAYSYTLAAGDVVMVTLSSSAFDAALLVRRPGSSSNWLVDSNSGGGSNACLQFTADTAGAWQILATSPDVAGGAYHITVVKNANPLVPTALVEFDYAYDKAGNLLTATENQSASTAAGLGAVTADQYDALGRLTQTRQSVGGTVNKRADFVYNADGSTQSVTRYSNDGATTVATSTYTNDGMGRLTAIVDKHGATTLADYAWTYDQASRVTGIASQTNPGDNTNGASGITYDVNVRRNT